MTSPFEDITMRPTNLPVYIFDLDGTLALVDHRRHMVEAPKCPRCDGFGRDVGMHHNYPCEACAGKGKDRSFKPNWKGFYAACVNDQPKLSGDRDATAPGHP